jgi:deoxyribonuclease-4
MYEVEIALLRGDVSGRFGPEFLTEVEQLQHFFQGKEIDSRSYILDVWTLLKNDAKAKKADPREPLERLYDLVAEAALFPHLNEEQLNHRLIAWLAGKELLVTA